MEFEVLDRLGQPIWVGGGTNGAGVIVDNVGNAIDGELWWKDACSALDSPGKPKFQPHHQIIRSSSQAQIYQELVTAPADVKEPKCGHNPAPGGNLTTSFLSICGHAKDNRLLPHGFLPLKKREEVALSIGADKRLADAAGSIGVQNDIDYRDGGGDSFVYRIPLNEISGTPVAVRARLHSQSLPPYSLQDRFCTAQGNDRDRLYFLAGHLNLKDSAAAGWKFELVNTGPVWITPAVAR